MKILHLLYESEGDYFGVGGVATRAYEIYRYLKERHDITLLCKRYIGAKDRTIYELRHIFVGTESKSLTKTFLSYAYQSVKFVKKYGDDYDIVIEDFSPAIPTFLHAFTKRPIVLQVQGYTGLHYFKKYNPVYALILFSLEKGRPWFYKNFIFINQETIKRIFGWGNPSILSPEHNRQESTLHLLERVRKRGKVAVIPNGISLDLLNMTTNEGDYILYLGRIDIYSKGLDTLIGAYKEFFKSFPDIRLVIAGDGKDRQKLEAMLLGLPLVVRRNIELTGWVTGDKKSEIIRNALFCILPSRHEIQGITALESMACGKAIIVSDIPELEYIVQNKAGMGFKVGNASSLANIMKSLLVDNKRSEMGENGREMVKLYTWDKIATRYEGFLNEVLNKS